MFNRLSNEFTSNNQTLEVLKDDEITLLERLIPVPIILFNEEKVFFI